MSAELMPPWPAVPSAQFPEFARASGVWLYTADGRQILDAAGQACVANIGYGRKEVVAAAARALEDFTHALPPFATPQRLQLVNTLRSKWLPPGLTRIHFVNSGSEATDAAIRLARQYQLGKGRTARWKVIGREASYHGVTLGALGVSGHAERREGFEPLLSKVPLAPACYPLRCKDCTGQPACTLRCADALEALIESEGPDSVAAFIGEAVVGTSGGALVPSDDYWPRIQSICRRHDILLIIDEVITGFGRTGRRFAFEHWGIEPDVVITAKGFTGGYAPLAAVITTDAVIAPLVANGDMMMFHTCGGHPAACAAANAVLDIIEREGLVERAAQLGAYLGQQLEQLRRHPNVAEVRGRGLLWAIELVRDKGTLERFPREDHLTFAIVRAGLERGVLFYFGGTGEHRDIICLAPAFIIERSEIDRMVAVLEQSIDVAIGERR
ncbi:MAG TPA: aspartate aminotransferase family protein [Steroidobacteraceae bacterium]|nr:aspartate aminotransferase family protein [Steroidobacteraceae bacterium]